MIRVSYNKETKIFSVIKTSEFAEVNRVTRRKYPNEHFISEIFNGKAKSIKLKEDDLFGIDEFKDNAIYITLGESSPKRIYGIIKRNLERTSMYEIIFIDGEDLKLTGYIPEDILKKLFTIGYCGKRIIYELYTKFPEKAQISNFGKFKNQLKILNDKYHLAYFN